jgi:hypothetical protein
MLVAGACVASSVADAYCGVTAIATRGGCVVRPCTAGEQLDASTGACVGAALLRQAAADSNVSVEHDAPLACEDGSPPVLGDGRLACVPRDALCPRGTRRRGSECDRAPSCAAGEARDGDRCHPLVRRGGRGPLVDVGAWLYAVVGPDGGEGSHDLCAPIALRPAAFGVAPRAAMRVRVTVDLRIPDQDTSLVQLEVAAVDEATGLPLPGAAASLVAASASSLVETLRGLGGEASAAAAHTTVTCALRAQAPPSAAAPTFRNPIRNRDR